MSLCLAGAGMVVQIAASAFTLAWTHTIEHTRWQEDWRVTPSGLVVETARIEGSGAGMDPPDGAVLKDGFYTWHPEVPPLKEVVLRRAPQAGDWTLCAGGECTTLGARLGIEADPVTLSVPRPHGGCAG